MNSKQQLVAFLGIFLVGLTIWFNWKDEFRTMLFNGSIQDAAPATAGSSGQSGFPDPVTGQSPGAGQGTGGNGGGGSW